MNSELVHHKRGRFDIFADILRAARELEDIRTGKIPPSNILAKAMVPYDRGMRYLEQAQENGLLDDDNKITEKGKVYLANYTGLIEIIGEAPHL